MNDIVSQEAEPEANQGTPSGELQAAFTSFGGSIQEPEIQEESAMSQDPSLQFCGGPASKEGEADSEGNSNAGDDSSKEKLSSEAGKPEKNQEFGMTTGPRRSQRLIDRKNKPQSRSNSQKERAATGKRKVAVKKPTAQGKARDAKRSKKANSSKKRVQKPGRSQRRPNRSAGRATATKRPKYVGAIEDSNAAPNASTPANPEASAQNKKKPSVSSKRRRPSTSSKRRRPSTSSKRRRPTSSAKRRPRVASEKRKPKSVAGRKRGKKSVSSRRSRSSTGHRSRKPSSSEKRTKTKGAAQRRSNRSTGKPTAAKRPKLAEAIESTNAIPVDSKAKKSRRPNSAVKRGPIKNRVVINKRKSKGITGGRRNKKKSKAN